MKIIIRILLLIIILIFGIGFYLKSNEYPKADMIIGIGVLVFAFILMPSFLYHRYRNKKLTDYTLNKEKIDQIIDNLNS
jgi:predicted permease